MSCENLRAYLRNYVGIGWTTTGLPIGLGYLAKVDSADVYGLLEIADELSIPLPCEEVYE